MSKSKSSTGIKIRALDKQTQDNRESIKPLHTFVLQITAPIAAGKTTLLANMLTHDDLYKHQFNRIIFISPTALLDHKVQELLNKPLLVSNQALQDRIDKDYAEFDESHIPITLPKHTAVSPGDIHVEYTPKILEELIKEQNTVIKAYGKDVSDKVLVIVDDSISVGIYKRSHQDMFARFITQLRHLNCSCVHINQSYKTCPKVIRSQNSAGIFFKVNSLERKDIFENFACGRSWTNWNEVFDIVTEPDYSFILFNHTNRTGYQIQERFERFI